jgi:pantothenate kinase
MQAQINSLTQHLDSLPATGRRLVAVVGAPGAGKSTLAEAVVEHLKKTGRKVQLVPMDGFHLDNGILNARGLFARKGAPQTFDAAGFLSMVQRLVEGDEVIAPTFDRARDISIAGAVEVPADVELLVLEGNYLLLDQPIWRELKQYWDLSVYLDVPIAELERRLIQRWLDHGLEQPAAEARARGNDLVNAKFIIENSLPADVSIQNY